MPTNVPSLEPHLIGSHLCRQRGLHGEYCPAPVTRDQNVLCRWDRQGDRSVKALRGFEQNCYAALKNLHHCEVILGRLLHHLPAPLSLPILPITRQRLCRLKQFPSRITHRDRCPQLLQIGFEKMVGDDQRLDDFREHGVIGHFIDGTAPPA